MPYRKPIALLLTWTVLVLVGLRLVPSSELLFDPPVFAYVLVVPLLTGLATAGPRGVSRALLDGLAADARDLPVGRRAAGAAILRSLGGTALAAGLLGFFSVVIMTFNSLAASGGQAGPANLLQGLPAMVIAPVYGLGLKAFFFDALADGLEGSESGLGADLE
jgi:hypothetical protein